MTKFPNVGSVSKSVSDLKRIRKPIHSAENCQKWHAGFRVSDFNPGIHSNTHTHAARSAPVHTEGDARDFRKTANPETGPKHCRICGKLSRKRDRLHMWADRYGVEHLIHEGCLLRWRRTVASVCWHCGQGDFESDTVGQFLNSKGGDVFLHQRCWSQWKSEQRSSVEEPNERDAQEGD